MKGRRLGVGGEGLVVEEEREGRKRKGGRIGRGLRQRAGLAVS